MKNWKQWYRQQEQASYEWYKADMMMNIALVILGTAVGTMFMAILILAGV